MNSMNEGRNAGVLLHPTSLPSKCGIIGDFGASAEPFLAYLKDAGFTYWQVLPVNPCTYSKCQPGCPYLSTSSFALNPLLVCPVGLVTLGLVTEEQVEQLVLKWQSKQYSRREVNTGMLSKDGPICGSLVDYHTAKCYKEELLALAYREFCKTTTLKQYEAFLSHNKFWLDGYVLFEAIQARHPEASSWLEWPEEYRSYKTLIKDEHLLQKLESPCPRQESEGDDSGPSELLLPGFHRFVQFILALQWDEMRRLASEKGIKILGDIAFYVNMHSSDVWSNSEMFQIDASTNVPLYVSEHGFSGVPPDYFSAEGQLWGHPVYAWEAHARSNFSWWTHRVAGSFEKFDACRLDHFRGFASYWRVPYEFAITHKSAREGEWVQGPGTSLFDAIFKNMGWEIPKVNASTAFSEALKKRSEKPSIFRSLATRLKKGAGANSIATAPETRQSPIGQLTNKALRPAPLLIAEDLGLITPEIVALRDQYSISSMRVMQFAWADDEKGLRCEHLPYNHTRDCVVYTGTHDNPTCQSWWNNASEEQKKHLTNYLGQSIYRETQTPVEVI